jgi:hypothetical protein
MSFISNLTNLFKEYLVVLVVVNQVACQELRNSRLLEPAERQHFILSFKKSSILKGLVLHRLQKNRIAAYMGANDEKTEDLQTTRTQSCVQFRR